jgi:hypothetical protein
MSNENHSENRILLKDLIRQVRAELTDAISEREKSGGAPMFLLDKVTLEVSFTVERARSVEAEASGTIWALVGVKGGGELGDKREHVHKITLELSTFTTSQGKPKSVDSFKVTSSENKVEVGVLVPIILETVEDQLAKKHPIYLKNYFKGKKFTCGHDGKFFIDIDSPNLPE